LNRFGQNQNLASPKAFDLLRKLLYATSICLYKYVASTGLAAEELAMET